MNRSMIIWGTLLLMVIERRGGTEGKERQGGRTDTYCIHANTCGSGLLHVRTLGVIGVRCQFARVSDPVDEWIEHRGAKRVKQKKGADNHIKLRREEKRR